MTKKSYFILLLLLLTPFLASCVFSMLPSITFYGRVIDQYGLPVTKASVWYEGTNAYLSAGGGRGKVMTDEEGYFEIDTVGATLSLGSVKHPDIEYSYQQDMNGVGNREAERDRLKSTKSFLPVKDNAGIYDNWRKYTEKDNAYIIHAWRLSKYEGAIKGGISAGVLSDSRVYTLKLHEQERRDRLVEGRVEGDFHISCTRAPIKTYKDQLDWSVSIVPVTGGVQETTDLFMNIAPVSGYEPALNISMRVESSEYKSYLPNKRYYFTTDNGKNYGSFYVNIIPFASIKKNACSIQINFKLNPTGSRNLELKN